MLNNKNLSGLMVEPERWVASGVGEVFFYRMKEQILVFNIHLWMLFQLIVILGQIVKKQTLIFVD
jgi:hypothetical protein